MPTLVLLRHGESTWNKANLFTGWVDVDLTELGVEQARNAGRLLREHGVEVDTVHTSLLRRAIRTANLALDELDLLWLPVARSWRLNERHYGALQGKNKAEVRAEYGDEQFTVWRRSYDVPPPPVDESSPHHPAHDRRYRLLPPDILPATECLADVVTRMLPYWYDTVVPDLLEGRTVLISAHGNSLRGLVKHLDGLSDDEVVSLNIPTGQPLVYTLDERLRVVRSSYLDEEAARAAADAVAAQGR